MEIRPAARKHGIADEDIPTRDDQRDGNRRLDDDLRLYLGPARNATLLEVVTVQRDGGSELAIHATKMRESYRRLLPGG